MPLEICIYIESLILYKTLLADSGGKKPLFSLVVGFSMLAYKQKAWSDRAIDTNAVSEPNRVWDLFWVNDMLDVTC